MEGKRLT